MLALRFIFGFVPVPVVYTRRMLGRWGAGRSYGVFVAIDPEKRADRGLLEHELQHCRQFYRSLGLNALLYFLSKRHRYRQEVECYAVQLIYSEDPAQDVGTFASYIHRHYGLGKYVTPLEARQRLSYEYYLRSSAVR